MCFRTATRNRHRWYWTGICTARSSQFDPTRSCSAASSVHLLGCRSPHYASVAAHFPAGCFVAHQAACGGKLTETASAESPASPSLRTPSRRRRATESNPDADARAPRQVRGAVRAYPPHSGTRWRECAPRCGRDRAKRGGPFQCWPITSCEQRRRHVEAERLRGFP
jgi:hypothetical protein